MPGYGYILIGAILSIIHGIEIITLTDCHFTYQDHTEHFHVHAVELIIITIVNVNKPPSENWSSTFLNFDYRVPSPITSRHHMP
jgi:hypothetical protein